MSYYIHNLDPIAFRIGSLAFPWYWLVYCLGYFWFLFSLEKFIVNKSLKMSSKSLYSFVFGGFIALLLGGRLGYVFFYNWPFYQANPQKIVALWEGGMSFHGALALSAIWVLIYSKIVNIRFFNLSDHLCFLAPPVLAFGRLANFINGELAGRVSDVPWAVIFPRIYGNTPRHPSQLYEAFIEGILLFGVMLILKGKLKVERFMSSLFLIGYGLGRFVVEYFREPDQQLGFIIKELTLGQLFCLMMILIGVIIFISGRRKYPQHNLEV
ncbi:prolipoprotein diacylglyceryl transferase [Halobacteriovorax sp. GB3]|uniref:prolipoprotein diacylglyceryl transferase n=1 Tax=Halobacteriovorax sp. GB3 TaxID=2719615 RepID=UPI00235DD785|nr:prolipoprotein diacylglyceryl transferase [Halobacteriovorax sp. GB3]MDD0851907.1 prolipoprotein diacylglyceryl transferase [Halobacteriovorax sp. GB3]